MPNRCPIRALRMVVSASLFGLTPITLFSFSRQSLAFGALSFFAFALLPMPLPLLSFRPLPTLALFLFPRQPFSFRTFRALPFAVG